METRRQEIDPFEGIDDPTLRVQMQHEMRAIEELVFVTKLSFVPAHKDKAQGFRSTLSCALCKWHDNCGKGQEQAVQLSRERTTLLACLQELRKRLQDRHGFRCAQAVAKKAAADAACGTANGIGLRFCRSPMTRSTTVGRLKPLLVAVSPSMTFSTRRGLRRLSSLPCMMMLR